MTPFDGDMEPNENDDPAEHDLAKRLQADRPVPAAAFRGNLRRRLLELGPGRPRPQRLWVQVASYGGAGFAMLAVAGAGLAGVGPFAA